MKKLSELPGRGVLVTAQRDDSSFSSRAFFPKLGVDEDPVTGSAHCLLVPYWSQKLQKKELTGYQLSERGGVLHCRDEGERVAIAGSAALYFKGQIYLGD